MYVFQLVKGYYSPCRGEDYAAVLSVTACRLPEKQKTLILGNPVHDQGYSVASFYYLVRNRTKRERMPGFHQIIEIFGETRVRECIAEADAVLTQPK